MTGSGDRAFQDAEFLGAGGIQDPRRLVGNRYLCDAQRSLDIDYPVLCNRVDPIPPRRGNVDLPAFYGSPIGRG